MSSAKSLPALPTPVLEQGCESKTNCSRFVLFLQGGILLHPKLLPCLFFIVSASSRNNSFHFIKRFLNSQV